MQPRSAAVRITLAQGLLAVALLFPGGASAQSAVLKGSVAWAALTVQQQTALAPLKRDWQSIDAGRQHKWLDVAARFTTLSPAEQERIQDRMGDWARMTPDQRSRARLNYQELRQLDAGERQTRWQAYQSLPGERRNEFARQAKQPAPEATRSREDAAKSAVVTSQGQAAAIHAVTPTTVQARPGATTNLISQMPSPPAHQQTGLPKMTAKPGFVDPNTLLPRRGVQGAAIAARPDPPQR